MSVTHSANGRSGTGPDPDFRLPVPEGEPCRQARGWLWLGLISLVFAGLFAVLLVLSRTPFVQDIIPFVDFFHTALVVHVDLSVLVWFVAFAGVFWSLHSSGRFTGWGWSALGLSGAGTAVMVLAPFAGTGNPLMSNYIPVLQQPVFLIGLVLFGAGFALLALRALLFAPPVGMWISGTGALRFGLNTAVVAAVLALLAFAWSFLAVPSSLQSTAYYELLFWGGGHVLQFTHTHLMLVAWLWLASASGAAPRIGPRVVVFLFAWGLLAVFITPLIYLAYDVGSVQHRLLFTWQMQFGGSLAALLIGAAVLLGLVTGGRAPRQARAERATLWASLVLFTSGGIIGFLIQGSNVTIPAHYHGSIVGVTLAFMGIAYHLLPRFGYEAPSQRLAVWQAGVYGGGQMLHILGLAWSGGYGVQRKTAGAAQGLDSIERIVSMGMMGLGGLISIIGGVLFLVVVFGAIYRSRRGPAAARQVSGAVE
ncbi:MAG: cytochrome C oxidase subunit I [Gammaproteobacteria bacterium]|nr:cytochrome C oxidase subunit I [Gammaproteobacteria bacterium]NIR98598.1 cytochrome C oxidase subunit I [Gammaproteobacteria bacterium]NIT64321.1 cytochrome C oxidase subunit I [Gammaproteobacteria bacterium]NIV21245.1 cytochrome C oxidase subunit I [Gammaproteobacteria bacterium]NIX10949.1 cytochrome C oxidase subunit I [Gammaproteobacteria bacterium]